MKNMYYGLVLSDYQKMYPLKNASIDLMIKSVLDDFSISDNYPTNEEMKELLNKIKSQQKEEKADVKRNKIFLLEYIMKDNIYQVSGDHFGGGPPPEIVEIEYKELRRNKDPYYTDKEYEDILKNVGHLLSPYARTKMYNILEGEIFLIAFKITE